MAKNRITTLGWAAIIVMGFQIYWYLVEVPSHSQPDQPGYQVTHPTTRRDKDIAPDRRLPEIRGAHIELPSELRDYSKYHERMKNRGRTEEQISRDYARAVRKYLEENQIDTYNKLLNSGIDPEYDLNEMDSGLDEMVPEY